MSEKLVNSVYNVTPLGVFGFFKEHRFLSNFHICPVSYEGYLYPSSENAYQAQKVQPKFRENFITMSPAESKAEWKSYPVLYTPEEWDYKKYTIMKKIVGVKFLSNPSLSKLLLDTGDLYLEETNWWGDTYWGVFKDNGQNNLGKILQDVRSFLR